LAFTDNKFKCILTSLLFNKVVADVVVKLKLGAFIDTQHKLHNIHEKGNMVSCTVTVIKIITNRKNNGKVL